MVDEVLRGASITPVVAGLVLSDFGFAEVAETTPLRDAVRS